MRNALLASLALASAFVANTGCVLGCGSYEGAANRAFERGSEMILLCGNGGFVAALETEMVEGRFDAASGHVLATRGETGRLAFELLEHGDGTASAEQLGDATWTAVMLDKTAKDHSNVLCEDLEVRDWWTNPVSAPTTFVRRGQTEERR